MGNSAGKFMKALQQGNEVMACHLYVQNPDIRERLDPNNASKDSQYHNTPLHYAAKYGMKSLLRDFLLRGGNPNKQNSFNQTTLHLLMMTASGSMNIVDQRRLDCLHMLLKWVGRASVDGVEERLKLDSVDHENKTALHMAAASGLSLCVQGLVANGASLFIEDSQGLTACEIAERNQHDAVAAFLEAKMVFNLQDDEATETEGGALETGNDDEYFGLCAQDLQEIKDQLIVETSDMLQIPLFTAEALLRDHEWSREQLLESWMEDPLSACEKAGVKLSQDHSALDALKNQINGARKRTEIPSEENIDTHNCDICDEPLSTDGSKVEIPCGHTFCKLCWERYLSTKIVDGDTHNILCPGHDCKKLVPVEITERLISRDMAKRYLQFDIKAFVDTNPNLRWCPHPGCGRAVKLPGLVSNSRGRTASASTQAKSVDCGQGHYFCWICLDEAHEPCTCETWRKWKEVVEEINPNQADQQAVERESVANAYWLISNSKKCPNCRSHIQKNEGCNHMTCTKCKHDFCWVCLEPWKIHSAETGGYFRCNRYEVVNAIEEDYEKEHTKLIKEHDKAQKINRFMHYYTRSKNHENSFKLESRLLSAAQEKVVGLQKTAAELGESCDVDVNFIEDSIKVLLIARQILKGSYPYGYFLEDLQGERTVFESLQDEVEQATETLSGMVARPFLKTPRSKIINATRKLRRKKRDFLTAIERGLIPDDDEYGNSSRHLTQRSRRTVVHRFENEEENNSNASNFYGIRNRIAGSRNGGETQNSDSDRSIGQRETDLLNWLEMIRLELREANSTGDDEGRQGAISKIRRRVEEAYRKRKTKAGKNSRRKKVKNLLNEEENSSGMAAGAASASGDQSHHGRHRRIVLFTDESSSEEEPGYAKKATPSDAPVVVTDDSDSDSFSDCDLPNLQASAAAVDTITKTVMAQFDYEGYSPSELSFEAGDMVEVIEKNSDGWWRGKCNGKIGLFPANFVVDLEDLSGANNAEASNETPAVGETNANGQDDLLRQAIALSLTEN